MTNPWQLMLVDDHPLLRHGLCQLLAYDPRFKTPWEASSGPEALEILARQQPDLVLLDLNMRPLSGLDTLEAIRQEWPGLKVVIFTVSDQPGDIQKLLNAGANGYLLKDSEPDQLLEGIAAVMAGERVLTEPVKEKLALAHSPSWQGELTPRELEVAKLVAAGQNNKIISETLFISEGTAKVHVKNLMRKTGCHTRVELTLKLQEL